MKKFLNRWKEDKGYLMLIKALIAGLLPVACCLVYCAGKGKSIGEVYLPASQWNDELFYFKQVEGILSFGYPQGYFGFDESHALKLSFAAWSPVLVLPWIIWGLLFGWTLISPIYCNIVFLSLVMVAFVCLVKINWKQLGILVFLFILYTPFVRYMLSGMPEILCFGLLILFVAFGVRFVREEKTGSLVGMFVLSGLLTLMRPYFLLFMLLPIFFMIRQYRWKGILGSVAFLGTVLFLYAMIKHYLGAEYFAPLFFTDWVDAFFERGFIGGLSYTWQKFVTMGSSFMGHAREGMGEGLASGAIFCSFLVMGALFAWQTISGLLKWLVKRNQPKSAQEEGCGNSLPGEWFLYAHMAFCFLGMLVALLLMYKLTEGSKHLLTFMAAGIFLISLMETRYYKKVALIGIVFAYLFTYKALDPYDYQVPFADAYSVEQILNWQSVTAEHLVLTKENVPNYDNCVIWTLSDETKDGWKATKWQLLYALPKGFGISCCDQSYIRENFDGLQSRYLAVIVGGPIDRICDEKGFEEIYRDRDMVLYKRY